MAEIKLLTQEGSVQEYQDKFDRAMTRLSLSTEYAIGLFIVGLKVECRDNVRSH